MSQKVFQGLAAVAVLLVTITMSQPGRAEGWWMLTRFDETTHADCLRRAKKALRGIAGEIQSTENVVYGYDLNKRRYLDSIIRCQRPKSIDGDTLDHIIVLVIVFNSRSKNKNPEKPMARRIMKRYRAAQ